MLWGSFGVRNSCGHLFLASSAELDMSTDLRRSTLSLSGQSKTFYANTKYSKLAQVNVHNVANLKEVWRFESNQTGRLETTPARVTTFR
jgi:glucose dehydrogenase